MAVGARAVLVLAVFFTMTARAQSPAAAKEAAAKATPKVTKTAPRTKPGASASHVVPAGVTVNACGCYRTEAGACFCGDKNGKCACPGECEPIACEQKRSREMQREIAAETKKAQDEEKKRLADEAAAQAAQAAAARAAANPDAALVTDDLTETSEDSTDKKAPAEKADKAADKPATHKARKRVAKP